MRRLLPLSLALALLASAARAQSDARIELYSDDLSSPCSLIDTRPGPRSVFIYQTGTFVAAASEFSVRLPSCWTGAAYVGEAIDPSLLAIGNPQTDLSVAYGGCRVPPVYIGRVDFFASGIASACCVFRAQPSPSGLLVVDCAFETHAIVAGPGITINPDETCPCNVAPPPPPPPPPSTGAAPVAHRDIRRRGHERVRHRG
ncbi:MAG: hypothetical protein OEY32_05290 [Candidatus Krumholzibacteria bacterium]|nr:hypothetical protein [Candidatus Krumholzibacteria bacterium]